MGVRPEPQRLHRRHPDIRGALDVLEEPVADEERLARLDPERVEGSLEDRRMRLARTDLGRENRIVDPLRDAQLLEVRVLEIRRVERVRDEPELQTAAAQ